MVITNELLEVVNMKLGTEIDCNIHKFCMKQLVVSNYEHSDDAHF
jgi:hypothetical protein